MPLKSKLTVSSVIFGVTIVLAAQACAGGLEIAVSEKHVTICAQAEERYKELHPNAKDDGAVIVKLYKYTFCPANVTVKVGTTVRWINVDKRTSHSVWLKDAGKEESERFFPDEGWEFLFMSPGDYPYLCGPHWESHDMRGYAKVIE